MKTRIKHNILMAPQIEGSERHLMEEMIPMTEDEELQKIRTKKLKERLGKTQLHRTDGVITLKFASFDKFLENTNLPVLVDFWAEWCMPCRIMAPVMKELALDYEGKALFAKINVDENPEVASRYNIMRASAHFTTLRDGRPAERIVGVVGRGPMEEVLKKHL
jgi:thioredoxin 1